MAGEHCQTIMAGEHKNSVSALMELAAQNCKEAVFCTPYTTGTSHQPRFLCQWQYDGRAYPALFSNNKKKGKLLSAEIVLDELSRFPARRRRQYVTFKAEGIAHTLVDKNTIEGVDLSLFTEENVAINHSNFYIKQEQGANSILQSQDSRLDPVYRQPMPRMPRPLDGALAAPPQPGKMQAFDLPTREALARRSTLSTMTSVLSTPPLTLPELQYSNVGIPAGSDSLDISPYLKLSLKSKDSAITDTMDTEHRPLTVDSNVGSLKTGFTSDAMSAAAVNGYPDLEITNGIKYLAIQPRTGGGGILTPPDDNAMEVQPEHIGVIMAHGKNAISALHELGQKVGIKPEFRVLGQSGPPHIPTFECQCVFDQLSSTVYSRSKVEGKQEAFKRVLEQINQEELLRSGTLTGGVGKNAAGYNPNKNPISELMELGNKLSILPKFECEQVSVTPVSRFKGWCVFGDRKYGPIEGRNKQETKTNVFQYTLNEISSDPTVRSRLSRQQHGIISSATPGISSRSATASPNDITPLSSETIQNLLSQKHPVSAFLEYAQARKKIGEIVEVKICGPPHCRSFAYKCTLNDESFPSAEARTRKEAKKHAAELALRALSGKDSPSKSAPARSLNFRAASGAPDGFDSLKGRNKSKNNNAQDTDGPSSLAPMPSLEIVSKSDKIAQHVLVMFTKLKSACGADLGKVILAGFVIENMKKDEFNVISVGTGNKCISGQHLSMDGEGVNDCHAEVIARRGLLRFFYLHIERYRADPNTSIFNKAEDSEQLTLKPHLLLHLYISTAPCGDGAIFTHNDSNSDLASYNVDDEHSPTLDMPSHGQLRSKMEVGEGTIPTTTAHPIQTYDGIGRGDRLKTMSCSDKICKWNVLGVQGTLLSEILRPVYISSMVLGQLFHPGHLSRALCCRVKSFSESLSTNNSRFKLNHMKIDRTTQVLQRSIAKSKPISLNWVKGDNECELLNAEMGHVIPTTDQSANGDASLISRVSRKCLYRHYLNVRPPPTEYVESLSYRDAKSEMTEYSQTKEQLYEHFSSLGYGYWIRKPAEQNMFKL